MSLVTNLVTFAERIASEFNSVRAEISTIELSPASPMAVVTLNSSDVNVYAGSSIPPAKAPDGTSGWYFKNSVAGHKFGWYLYNGILGTQKREDITSIFAVIRFYNTAARPFIGIYSKPTGTGDVIPGFAHSRWVYATYSPASIPAPGMYLVYFGADPGISPELPRIQITNTMASVSAGDRLGTEQILTYAWTTDSGAAVNTQEVTFLSAGNVIGGKLTTTTFVHDSNTQEVPSGTVTAFAGSSYSGSDWLLCDGSAVSRTTYANLFSVVGTTYGEGNGTTTFNVPDYRGVFLRGLDAGRGIDPNRNLGSLQDDEIKAHTHDALAGGTYPGVNTGSGGYGGSRYGDAYFPTSSTGGSETRPKNVSVNYLIKT